MKKRKLIIAAIVGALLVGAMVLLRHSEPLYEGRGINSWLDDHIETRVGNPVRNTLSPAELNRRQNRSSRALVSLGTNGIPYILARVGVPDSYWQKQYAAWVPKAPLWTRRYFPKPRTALKESDARTVFYQIGSASIPPLLDALNHPSPLVRQTAALGISTFAGDASINRSVFDIGKLTAALQDSDNTVRYHAAGALAKLTPESRAAIPALVAVLNDPKANDALLTVTLRDLALFGAASSNAIPGLKRLLPSDNNLLRAEAALALWQIGGDATIVVPVFVETTPTIEVRLRGKMIEALAEMGPRASNAFPMLVKQLKVAPISDVNVADADRWVIPFNREKVTNALFKIDPEAAAKVVK